MQLTARLVQILPLQTGTGRNGEWKKQDIIVETDGQYPKKVCVAIWGDKINPSQLVVGNNLSIDFDVESREFNGRWYTDVKAWRVESVGAAADPTGMGAPVPEAQFSSAASAQTPPPLPANPTDDLPF